MKDRTPSIIRQNKWELTKAKKHYTFDVSPNLSTTACIMLLLAQHVQGQKLLGEMPSEEKLPYKVMSLNNTFSESDTCSVSEAPDSTNSFQKENTVVPQKISKVSEKTNKKLKKVPSPHYAKYFLSEAVDEIPIEIDLERRYSGEPAEQLSKKMARKEKNSAKALKKRIEEAFPTLSINPELLDMIKQTNLKIIIVSKKFFDETFHSERGIKLSNLNKVVNQAVYLCRSNTIFISVIMNSLGERQLKGVLLNDLYHAFITVRNFLHVEKNLLDTKATALLYPFLDKNGDVDDRLASRLTNSYEEFWSNIHKFIDLYIKQEKGETLNSDEKLFFNQAIDLILEHYSVSPSSVSFLSIVEMRKSDYEAIQRKEKSYSDGSIRLPQSLVGSTAKYDLHAYPFDDETTSDGRMRLACNYDHPNEPKSRIITFIEDMKNLEASYTKGTKENVFYGNKGAPMKSTEFSSDINTMDPKMKQFFASIWCKAHKNYHGLEKEYCYTSSPIDGSKESESGRLSYGPGQTG